MALQNPTIGSGELWFAEFTDPDNYVTGGETYIGNTTSFTISTDNETMDHFDTDHGFKEKDESITIRRNYTAAMTTDNMSQANLRLFFSGKNRTLSASAVPSGTQTIAATKGLTYQIGASVTLPAGLRKLTSATLAKGVTPLVLDTDYTIDLALGRVTFLATGSVITNGDSVTVSYVSPAQSRRNMTAGKDAIAGALRFISYNPQGTKYDYYMPYVKISPNGDLSLKGDDWLNLTYNVEIMKADIYDSAIYIDGRPA